MDAHGDPKGAGRMKGVDGIEGFPIEIEASLIQGMPCISIIGLGDQAVQEVRK